MGRAPCCDKNGLKKGPWTPEEDHKLIHYIHKHGYGNWTTLPKHAGLQRCGKSCRLRWTNYLRPDIKRGRFTFEEEHTIIQLHSILGNKWSAIASRLPGRTDNEIKNYWNTHIRKRLLRMGIDPVTHTPRLDLLDLSSLLTSLYASSSQMSHNHTVYYDIQSLLNAIHHPPLHQLNPELQKLAYSQSQILTFCAQNHGHQHHQIPNYHDDDDDNDRTLFQAQEILPSDSTYVDPNFSNFINYGVPDHPDLQTSLMEPPLLMCDEASNFHYSNNLCFDQSVLSTPSSSPTPINSNSSTCTDQDESSSSYDMLKFDEISDILNVNEFM